MGSHNIKMHRGNLMTSNEPEEKENITADKFLPKKNIKAENADLGLALFRRKIKMRVERCQEILQKIDHDSRLMRICFLQLMDLVDNCRKIVKEEQEQNIRLLQILDGYYPEKTDLSSKTQTVSVCPMVDGVPIKRASILLKRLDPLQEIQAFNNLKASTNSSELNSTLTSSRRTLTESIQPLNQETHVNSAESRDGASPLGITLPHCQVRCRRWPGPVSPASWQEYRLKQASIHLIRLDPRRYLIPEEAEIRGSQNEPFDELDLAKGAFHPVSSGNLSLRLGRKERAQQSNVPNSLTSCYSQRNPYFHSKPLVILERLEFSTKINYTKLSSSLKDSLSSGACHVIELLQTNDQNENNVNCSSKSAVTNIKKHKIEEIDLPIPNCIVDQNKRRTQVRENCVRKRVQESKDFVSYSKRRKHDISSNKNKSQSLPSEEKRKSSEKEIDEDPLEGPSWLYKDGILKKAKLKRLRKDYLTPFYYLPPTIYSSSEESEDEVLNKKNKKSCKMRKLRQTRKN